MSFKYILEKMFCNNCVQFMKVGAYQVRNLNNKCGFFSRPHRLLYARLYPTLLVFPDGSTTTIRYPEPRKIIKMPLDLSTLSEEEKKERLEKRKPKKRVVIQEDIEDNFDSKRYLKMMKKR